MNARNVQFNLFDAFGFIFPGFLILFSLLILAEDSTVVHLKDSFIPLNKIPTSLFIVATFLAYVVGFLVNTFGYRLYKKLGSRLWEMPKEVKLGREQARYSVLVREFSPRNMAHLEKWNALKAMSHNFSVSFLVLFAVAIIKTITHWGEAHLEWAGLALVSLYFAYSLLQRAFFYHRYYYEDLRHSVEALELEAKAHHEAQTKYHRGRERPFNEDDDYLRSGVRGEG
jgi:hypothetical protein